jgi:hypothetical protein
MDKYRMNVSRRLLLENLKKAELETFFKKQNVH